MTLNLTSDRSLSGLPTTWGGLGLIQVASLAGRVESEHPFAHAFGCPVISRDASELGIWKNGP